MPSPFAAGFAFGLMGAQPYPAEPMQFYTPAPYVQHYQAPPLLGPSTPVPLPSPPSPAWAAQPQYPSYTLPGGRAVHCMTVNPAGQFPQTVCN